MTVFRPENKEETMHTKKLICKIAAMALLTGILLSLTGCPPRPAQTAATQKEICTTVESSSETTVEPTTGTTVPPVDLNEDLSQYALEDDDDLDTVVSKMEHKYGVDIVYGNDVRTEFVDENETLTVKPNTNLKDVEAALRSMDEGLGALPKGFLKQLPYGKHKILKIYLTGQITVNGTAGATIPAFTSDADDELYLTIEVLDQGVINVPTVLHELTHIVDFKLKHDGLLKEDEWAKLNPEGFTYDNSYGDSLAGKKDPKYCYSTEHYIPRNTDNSNNDIWFYYCYSKVNAYEDRATLMENLIIYKMWKYEVAPGLYQCPHMKAKLEYFLKLIEKDFAMTKEDKEAWQNVYYTLT